MKLSHHVSRMSLLKGQIPQGHKFNSLLHTGKQLRPTKVLPKGEKTCHRSGEEEMGAPAMAHSSDHVVRPNNLLGLHLQRLNLAPRV